MNCLSIYHVFLIKPTDSFELRLQKATANADGVFLFDAYGYDVTHISRISEQIIKEAYIFSECEEFAKFYIKVKCDLKQIPIPEKDENDLSVTSLFIEDDPFNCLSCGHTAPNGLWKLSKNDDVMLIRGYQLHQIIQHSYFGMEDQRIDPLSFIRIIDYSSHQKLDMNMSLFLADQLT